MDKRPHGTIEKYLARKNIDSMIKGLTSYQEPGENLCFQCNRVFGYYVIERHSMLVLNIAMGKHHQATTDVFIEGLRHATHGEFQITTDGFVPYKSAIETTLADRVDFAQLIKVYRAATGDERRYSPPEVSNVEVVPVVGRPDPERICTSIVERQNLSVRMGTRRFTRLTNAFSKKWENHWAAVALWFGFYNFCRVHKSFAARPPWRPRLPITFGPCENCWRWRDPMVSAVRAPATTINQNLADYRPAASGCFGVDFPIIH